MRQTPAWLFGIAFLIAAAGCEGEPEPVAQPGSPEETSGAARPVSENSTEDALVVEGEESSPTETDVAPFAESGPDTTFVLRNATDQPLYFYKPGGIGMLKYQDYEFPVDKPGQECGIPPKSKDSASCLPFRRTPVIAPGESTRRTVEETAVWVREESGCYERHLVAEGWKAKFCWSSIERIGYPVGDLVNPTCRDVDVVRGETIEVVVDTVTDAGPPQEPNFLRAGNKVKNCINRHEQGLPDTLQIEISNDERGDFSFRLVDETEPNPAFSKCLAEYSTVDGQAYVPRTVTQTHDVAALRKP